MHAITTILTTAMLLVHSAFGCCLHHSHSCELGCGESHGGTTLLRTSLCPCESHPHHDADAEDEKHSESEDHSSEHSHHEHNCDGVSCSFARTETVSDGTCLIAIDCVPVSTVSPIILPRSSSGLIGGVSPSRQLFSGTVRLHLAIALMLI